MDWQRKIERSKSSVCDSADQSVVCSPVPVSELFVTGLWEDKYRNKFVLLGKDNVLR